MAWGGGTTPTITMPSGWLTAGTQRTSGTGVTTQLYYRLGGFSGTTVLVSVDSGSRPVILGAEYSFSGVATFDVAVSALTASGTAHGSGNVNPTDAFESLLIGFWGATDNVTFSAEAFTGPSTGTDLELLDFTSGGAGGNDCSAALAQRIDTLVNAGNYSVSATSSGTTICGAFILIIRNIVATTYTATLTGAMTPSGLLLKLDKNIQAGAMTPSGTLLKQDNKIAAGGMTPSGLLLKKTNKIATGGMTPTGLLLKLTQKIMAGAMTPTGLLLKRTNKIMTGSMTPTGLLLKQGNKALAGGMTPTGAIIKRVNKVVVGAMTPTGLLLKLIKKIVAGALTPTGTLVDSKVVVISGSSTPTGALVKLVKKVSAGGMTPTGLLSKLTRKIVAGGSTPTGSYANTMKLKVSGCMEGCRNMSDRIRTLLGAGL